jgi:hypothetical protein
MRMEDLQLLLDDERLNGVRGVSRLLGPERVAAVLDASDVNDARAAIEHLCLVWGGGAGALLPCAPGAQDLEPRWRNYLSDGVFDNLARRGVLSEDEERDRDRGVFSVDEVHAESLLTFLWGLDRRRDDWAPVDCALPNTEDPWYLVYLACLGALPERPEAWQLRAAGFVEDFEFDRLLPVERGEVADPGPIDLVRRMRAPGRIYPARLSVDSLGVFSAPEASHVSDTPTLPLWRWERSRYGANIVVAYEPGSVEDLALLWNLRAAHGLEPSVPLGVPATSDVVAALKAWSSHPSDSWALRLFGLVTGRPWGLVSASVDPQQLDEWAKAAGGNWAAADPDVLLHPGERPGRTSADVATFVDGTAQVAGMASTDRELLHRRPQQARGYALRVRLRPTERHLPPARSFTRFLPLMEGYQGGGSESRVQESDRLVTFDWPSGWNVLEAVVRDRGLRAEASRPGRAAVALLQRLGSFDEVEPLLDPVVLDSLVQLGTRSGRAWFEQRVRDLQSGLAAIDTGAAARSAEIERQLSELRTAPFEADRVELTWDGLRSELSGDGAREWLGWAESRELLLRGAEIQCQRCGRKAWHPAAELAPPVICNGCGQRVPRPFPADRLPFRYRASERLLQVLSLNVVPHLLALRWLCILLEKSSLYGGHPGVEFRDDGGTVIGEADVVLVLSDGSLALGECKLTPHGLADDEITKLEKLADKLDAAWTFYAVPEWQSACQEPWSTLSRALPERPRFVLTNEQLLQPAHEIYWAAGTNPFAPDPLDQTAQQTSHRQFGADLPALIANLDRRFHTDQMLLDQN